MGLVLVSAAGARAQGFGDFEYAGLAEDARREPSSLTAGVHSFKPSFIYKLFGVTTPHVFAAASGGWTDNLLREDEGVPGVHRRREMFARGEAGARLDTQLSDHRLELEYRTSATDYLDTGHFETLDQSTTARLDMKFARFDLHGDLAWRRTTYPQSIQLRGLLRVDGYSASSWGDVGFGKFGMRAGVGVTRADYHDHELHFLDQKGASADLQLYWRLVPKLRVVVEYNWRVVQYDQGRHGRLNDFQVHTVRGGLDGAITPKISASVKVGSSFQDVSGDRNADRRAFRGLVAQGSVRWSPLPHTSVALLMSRSISVSTTSNYLLTDAIDLMARQLLWEDRIALSAHIGYSRAHVGPGDDLYRLDAGASAGWNIRQWLSVGLAYDWESVRSPFQNDDYDIHTVTASVGAGF